MRTWHPSVPKEEVPATLDTPLAKSGATAEAVPVWLAAVEEGLSKLLTDVRSMPEPTRVSRVSVQQMASDGRLTHEVYNLPAESSTRIASIIRPVTQGIPGSVAGQWWASDGTAVLGIIPGSEINRILIGTFGESQVRIQSAQFDTSWLNCSWDRAIPIQATSSPLTLSVQSSKGWAGVSSLATEKVLYQKSALITLGTVERSSISVEAAPSGTSVDVEWAESLTSIWFSTDKTSTTEEEVILSVDEDNLHTTLSRTLAEGTTIFLGRNGWTFESYSGKLIVDDHPAPGHESGGPGVWDQVDARVIRRGIVSFSSGGQEVISIPDAPEGLSWRARAYLFCLDESEGSYQLNKSDQDQISVVVNQSRLTLSSDGTYTIRFKPGLNLLELYGRHYGSSGDINIIVGTSADRDVSGQSLSSYRGYHYVQFWYAAMASLGTSWPRTAWAQDAGLTRPTAAQRDGKVRTSVAAYTGVDPSLPWKGQSSYSNYGHDPDIAKLALIRGPAFAKKVARIRLSGGPGASPIVKVSYSR